MPIVSIRHVTTYRYRKPVGIGEHRMMLRPMDDFDQRILDFELNISPRPSLQRKVHDASGVGVEVVRFDESARLLRFESVVRVDHTPGADFDLETDWRLDAPYDACELAALAPSIPPRHADAQFVRDWADRFVPKDVDLRASAVMSAMTQAIRGDFTYGVRLHGFPQEPRETLVRGQGSCRDFALLMVEAARSLGLAAKFVTGYIYAMAEGPRSIGGGHTHAWARVYLPGCGWTDFDPTNGIIGNTNLIRVAAVDDPRLAAPLYGSWDGDAGDFLGMDVEVDLSVESELQPIPRLRVAASR